MTPTQEDREAADSGFTPENIADAEWLWTNMAVDHRKFHTLPTHHKALLCHTAQRFRLAAEERGARMALEAAAKVAHDLEVEWERSAEKSEYSDHRSQDWNYATGARLVGHAIRQIDPAALKGAE